MNTPDIAIIINSFNRFQLLKECLEVLSDWILTSPLHDRIVCVIYEAGSTDGSREWLMKEASNLNLSLEVLLPKAGEDTSFAAGINKGVDYAGEKFASLKYLLFYETDNQILEAKPLMDALAQLENRNRLGACGFTVRKHDGTPTGVGQPFPSLINFALGKNIVDHFQLERIPYQWEKDKFSTEFSEVDVVYTSPLLVRFDVWKDSGGLDERLFPFSDCDVDWAYRLRNRGWKMGVVKTDAVIHDNQETLSNWSRSRAVQSHRGRLRYFKRHYPFQILLAWPFVLMLRHVFELVATKMLIKEPLRREQLSGQFSSLLKSTIRGYE